MCFTVAITRKGVLMTIEQYYNSLPNPDQKKRKNPMLPDFPDFYMINGFVHPSLPVIKENGIEMLDWGLIPNWVNDTEKANDIQSKTLNAKAETIFEKPSFRQNIVFNRCIVPVDGFYEWREYKGTKYPYFIQPADNAGFLLGSVFDSWFDSSTAKTHNTFSIVTTAANPLMEMIHNQKKRMPLILSTNEAQQWLTPDLRSEQIMQLMKPFDERLMKAHSISRIASKSLANRNIPDIWLPVDYPELNQQSLF
ncbi:MAG: SOS response-associated peptidase [Paludibacter sp.]|jgi:putative SOS response-associated peptidase YedK